MTDEKPKRKDSPQYGLSRRHTRRKSRDFLDMDYLDKLSPEERAWLDKFAREFYQASFTNTKRDLHKTKAGKREVYGMNNSRQRDMWNQFQRMALDPSEISDDDEEPPQ